MTFLRGEDWANPERCFSACFSAPPCLRVKNHPSNCTGSRQSADFCVIIKADAGCTAPKSAPSPTGSKTFSSVSDQYPESNQPANLLSRILRPSRSSFSPGFPAQTRLPTNSIPDAASRQGLVHCTVSSLSRHPRSSPSSCSFGRETEETFFSNRNSRFLFSVPSATCPPSPPKRSCSSASVRLASDPDPSSTHHSSGVPGSGRHAPHLTASVRLRPEGYK